MIPPVGDRRQHVGDVVEIDIDPRRITRGDAVEPPAESLAPAEHSGGVELAHLLVE